MHFDQSLMSSLFLVPFIGMLLSIAFMPLLFPHFWERHVLKISLGWAGATVVFLWAQFGFSVTIHQMTHMMFHEYIPFMLMIGALFTVTGGIHMVIRGRTTPLKNTGFLLIGSLIASLIGTTGAAILLIRPFLEMNKYRSYKVHLVVFFIFAIANIGGCLTPLGDPPLFLGYLNGIPFEWPFIHLLKPFIIVLLPLLGIFFFLDWFFFRRDPVRKDEKEEKFSVSLTGKRNIFFLIGIVGTVWASGMGMATSPEPLIFGLSYVELLRDLSLLAMMGLSFLLTPGTVRHYNHFTWAPFQEVGEVFIGIFVTLIPVIAMLKQGVSGPCQGLIEFANPGGIPSPFLYFWLTGILSAFLDNAPTYLVFFHMAQGAIGDTGPHVFLQEGGLGHILTAISAGAVFMGAMTYIGNAPNFMVRSIAESKHISMPSFFGYMVWSVLFLLPVLLMMSYFLF